MINKMTCAVGLVASTFVGPNSIMTRHENSTSSGDVPRVKPESKNAAPNNAGCLVTSDGRGTVVHTRTWRRRIDQHEAGEKSSPLRIVTQDVKENSAAYLSDTRLELNSRFAPCI